MVSWGKAFGTAVTIILMTIVWYVIGLGIALLVLVIAGGITNFAILADPRILTNPLEALGALALASGSIGIFYLALVGGVAISALGGIATILKYSAELIANETNVTKTLHLSPQLPSVRISSLPSKLCPACGAQSSATTKYCSNCGTKLQSL
jgi:hypothetical protein